MKFAMKIDTTPTAPECLKYTGSTTGVILKSMTSEIDVPNTVAILNIQRRPDQMKPNIQFDSPPYFGRSS